MVWTSLLTVAAVCSRPISLHGIVASDRLSLTLSRFFLTFDVGGAYMLERDIMVQRGGNLGWCRPYYSLDGKVEFSFCEGSLAALALFGADVPVTPSSIIGAARILGLDYPIDDEDALLFILDECKEGDCVDCPWFDACDAMDTPVEEVLDYA